jgi:ketosteroid isomerase-like protein
MKGWGVTKGALPILFCGLIAGAQQPRPQPLPQMPANGGDVYRDQIIAHERAALDALKSGDVAAFAAVTTDDGIFVDAHGLATKPQAVKNVSDLRLTDYTMADVRFVPVSAEGGLVAYTLTESGTSQGKPFSARVYVSSVWVHSGRDFVCVFSQETPATAAK